MDPKLNPVNPWHQPKPLLYMTPMSGITNLPYRLIVKRFASDMVFPEFVSIDAMHYSPEGKTMQLLRYEQEERPIIAQLFGSKPQFFYEGAKRVKELGFDGVDINFGCPAPKVAKSGGGCALLGNLELCREIIQAVIEAVGPEFPVSVKTRKSYKKTTIADFCNVIADLPLSALTVHGRSFEHPYEGAADLNCIKTAKQAVPFLVIASGHGHTPEAAKETLDYTGADGVGVARGTFGKPWLIQQIKEYLRTGTYYSPTATEILDTMVEHARLVKQFLPNQPNKPNQNMVEMRKILGWYIRSIPNAAQYRAQLVRVSTIEEIERIVSTIKQTLHSA